MALFFPLFSVLLVAPIIWPQIDLWASGLFFDPVQQRFFLSNHILFESIHFLATAGARVLAVALFLLVFAALLRRKPVLLNAKGWAFLLLALLVGPGLVANVGFKDNWGRFRPHQTVEFGGKEAFSAALTPRFEKARSNGSFVCGDGAFGFFLPAFAHVVSQRRKRRVFWFGMGAGAVFSFARLAMGAHFFSDIVYAALFMLATTAGLYAALYNRRDLFENWKAFFTRPKGA